MDANAAREMWSRGDYGVVGDWFADASRSCLDGLELTGCRLLDVACGTGAVAIEAARRGARVTGVDLTPTMLAEARRRAEAAGVDVSWVEGSFTDLSAHRDFDVVTSAFGVMFADDPSAVAVELLRTLRPAGTAVIAAWSPEGALGFPFPGIVEVLPSLGEMPDQEPWSTHDGVAAILAGARRIDPALPGRLDHVRTDAVHIPFDSAEDAVAQMRCWSGGWMSLFDALTAEGLTDVGHRTVVDHLRRFSTPVGSGVTLSAAYVIATISRDTR